MTRLRRIPVPALSLRRGSATDGTRQVVHTPRSRRSPPAAAVGDDAGLVRRPVQVRTDSAGCTGFVWHARSRNVGFAVIARSNAGVHAAISFIAYDGEAWQPALGQDGQQRPGAAVAEVTDHLDLSAWPSGTRLIVRREPLHPGCPAQPVPLDDVPLLGPLQRRRRGARRPRCAHFVNGRV